jgi:hypothetical protein
MYAMQRPLKHLQGILGTCRHNKKQNIIDRNCLFKYNNYIYASRAIFECWITLLGLKNVIE